MKIEDAFQLKNWGVHKNTLLADYNMPNLTTDEIKSWYFFKSNSWSKKYFSVLNEEDKFIGYIGIREIKRIRKQSTLGIVFDPNYVGQGYGSQAMEIFLAYYFSIMKMKTMYLAVAKFNKRAIRAYEKIGFKIIGEYLDLYYDQNLDLNDTYYKENMVSFTIANKRLYYNIYRMKITEESFSHRQAKAVI